MHMYIYIKITLYMQIQKFYSSTPLILSTILKGINAATKTKKNQYLDVSFNTLSFPTHLLGKLTYIECIG